MIIIRPIQETDLDRLYEISHKTGKGFTSLQPDKKFIEEKIIHSVKSFNQEKTDNKSPLFFFVAEDVDSKDLIGTAGIKSAIGRYKPWYSYKVNQQIHTCSKLGVYNSVDILLLCNNHTGSSELCSLFLNPEYRGKMYGLPLSKSRFMFIKAHKKIFSDKIIAEMRGFLDENNKSPFWEKFVRKFLPISFSKADFLSTVDKSFIAELMPRHPIYTNVIEQKAQDCIGVPHKYTIPAMKILQKEGFSYNKYIDIFDAGPLLECETSSIKSIQDTKKFTVEINSRKSNKLNRKLMIANDKLADFRCTLTSAVNIEQKEGKVATIDASLAEILLVSEGDKIYLHDPLLVNKSI
jgi:arginine N-succinyltransferase